MATSKVGLSGVQVMAALAALFFLLSGSCTAAGLCKGKQSWPELVGRVGEATKPIIEAQNPYVKNAIVVREGTSIPEDFRCDRVWIWVKPDGTISKTPTVG